jgi:leucyl-tRNA synthetase
MEYNFPEIEQRWKQYWNEKQVYKVSNESSKPKYYVLDMFPYPSGAGLHVGHPLGYIASDIYARYKRLKGYNVLHPMGFDAFGLPAEQYALETGQHPADTTRKNIERYKDQLNKIGFCYDWDRAVTTSDPGYYKWTQWIFLQLFHSWYDCAAQRARPITELIALLEKEGNINNPCPDVDGLVVTDEQWTSYSEEEQRKLLMHYRLAYQGNAAVWWCEALGTVLANDEVVNGVSERGGHPVERKQMRQWFLRITEYADRLLTGLDTLDWTDAMKEMQRNWVGKSTGAEVRFDVSPTLSVHVFTTRPDTIFGVDFLVLAPEHALVDTITTAQQKTVIDEYRTYVKSRSERERMADVKQITGCFTGAYAIHPLSNNLIPVWIAEYVLAGYGTGAIMAVPAGDDRDHAFAQHFNIPITNIFGDLYNGDNAYSDKSGTIMNSGFLTGMRIAEATEAALNALVAIGAGKRRTNFRLRDAGFSRQRYWGEPFPIVYMNDVPYGVDEERYTTGTKGANGVNDLPVELPHVDSYKPGPEGQGPLANLPEWVNTPAGNRETNTMPGYAGSSWYFLRYMDPHNGATFADRKATDYWQQVDLYVGGTEHAVGHLLYSRMWTKVLFDLGHIGFDEPFKKLLNQGMIQGSSRFLYRSNYSVPSIKPDSDGVTNWYISKNIRELILKGDKDAISYVDAQYGNGGTLSELILSKDAPIRIPIEYVDGVLLKIDELKKWNPNFSDSVYICEPDGTFICQSEVEKMSKSKYNVVNPDDIVAQYGADTFRMYEMFLGPIDVSKPWDTKGIEGVHRFLKKFWRLFAGDQGWIVTDDAPNEAELRTLHKTLKKISEDMERFSFNTSVSQFMICVNELAALGCHKRAVLQPLVVAITPFAPHIAEELWSGMGNTGTVLDAAFPEYEDRFIAESTITYGVSINGKKRVEMAFAADAEQADIEPGVLADATVQKWMENKPMKKFIFVKGKMINIVV